MSKFKVGDEVVCIEAGYNSFLVNGKQYIVSKVEFDLGQWFVYVDDGICPYLMDRFAPTEVNPYLDGYIDAMIESSIGCPGSFINEDTMALMDDNTYERTCMANLIYGVV